VSSEREEEQSAARRRRLSFLNKRALAAYLCIKMPHIMRIKGCCLCALTLAPRSDRHHSLFITRVYTTFEYIQSRFLGHLLMCHKNGGGTLEIEI
jgi:hypothetical protein